MGNTTAAGGTPRTVAVTHGKTGVYASVDGSEPRKLKVTGGPSVVTLAAALDTFAGAGIDLRVLLVGTCHSGEPGWDKIDPQKLKQLLSPGAGDGAETTATCEVVAMSEAGALHRARRDQGVVGYIILATALRHPDGGLEADNIVGSTRWWIGDGRAVTRQDVAYLGGNYGQVYTIGGGNLSRSPGIVAGMVEGLLEQHPRIRRVYVWSQDGIPHPAYGPDGTFWKHLRLPRDTRAPQDRVKILPQAFPMLQDASKPLIATLSNAESPVAEA